MDFVIFGVGTGAALVLIGWLGRDLGPRLRHRAPRPDDEVLGVEELVARVSWARFCGSAGAALALCGALLLLVTFATLVLRLSDDAGTTTMLATFAVVLVAMAVWSWAYVRRFGVYGVLAPRRPRAQPVAAIQPRPAPAVTMAPVTAAEPDATSEPASEPGVTPEPVVVAASEEPSAQPAPGEADAVAPTSEEEAERDAAPGAPAAESEAISEPPSDTAQAAEEAHPAQAEEVVPAEGTDPEASQAESDEQTALVEPAADEPSLSDTTTEPATDEQTTVNGATEESAHERSTDESSAPGVARRRRVTPEGDSYLTRFQPGRAAGRLRRASETATDGES